MPNYEISIPGAVEDHRSSYALPIWNYLIDEIGESGDVHQGEIAEDVSCSIRTVRKVLKGFARCNLIKIRSHNGQGRGIHLENLWIKRGKNIANKLAWKRSFEAEARYLKNPYSGEFRLERKRLDYISIPNRVITKGSAVARYIMWKLRTWVEKTHLANQSSIICGKLFNYFEGKPFSVAKTFLSRLKDSMLTDWGLTDFFVWFYDLVSIEEKGQRVTEQSRKQIKNIEEQKKKARESWAGDPPKLKDFGYDFDEYGKALEKWQNSQPEGQGKKKIENYGSVKVCEKPVEKKNDRQI